MAKEDTETQAAEATEQAPPPSPAQSPASKAVVLRSLIDGRSARFGEMRAGEEITQQLVLDEAGETQRKELTATEKRQFAKQSEFLKLDGD